MALEYRVRWQREGRGQSTRIYQTWKAAYNRYCTIKCWDDVKADSRYEDMPDLIYVVMEARQCPAWEPYAFQPDITDYTRERVREGIMRGEAAHEAEQEEAMRVGIPF